MLPRFGDCSRDTLGQPLACLGLLLASGTWGSKETMLNTPESTQHPNGNRTRTVRVLAKWAEERSYKLNLALETESEGKYDIWLWVKILIM